MQTLPKLADAWFHIISMPAIADNAGNARNLYETITVYEV
jgi:hypothetical protein